MGTARASRERDAAPGGGPQLLITRAQRKRIDREMSIFNFIRAYWKSNDESPTLEEIGQRFDLAPGTVAAHIRSLEAAKLITKKKGVARGIRLCEDGGDARARVRRADETRAPLSDGLEAARAA